MLRNAAIVGAAALARRPAFADEPWGGGAAQTWSNARILTGVSAGSGRTELRGGVRVEGGVIVAMGADVTGGTDLGGATVWPGTWETGSTAGLADIDLEASTKDDVETLDAFQPQVRAVDGFNPQSGVVSGQAAWMRTTGATLADATVMAPAGLVVNLGKAGASDKGPTSRLGVLARLRDVLDANPDPAAAPPPDKKKHAPVEPPKPPTRAEVLWHDLRGGRLKALFVADRASDIELALDLASEYALDAVIIGAAEGWMVARQLKDSGCGVVLGPVTVQPDSWAHPHARYDNAALLHAAGVTFGIRIGDAHRTYDLTTEAGIAVAWGLPYATAIAAITGNAPGLFGLQQGTLRVGGEATFVVSDGDPLEPRSSVKQVLVQGVDQPLVNHQTELYDRFRVLK